MDKKLIILRSFILSAVTAIVFIAAATIAAELVPAFKNFLKEIFGHHWTGKGVVAAAIFVFGGFLCWFFHWWRGTIGEIKQVVFWLWILFSVSIAGFLAILLFFIYEWLAR